MKKLLFMLTCFVGLQSWGQVDTLEFTTSRAIADTVFGNLDPQLYNGVLVDRSMSTNEILAHQVQSNYSDTMTGYSWIDLYSNIALSYIDSTEMYNDSLLLQNLYDFEKTEQMASLDDQLIQPFGLLLHTVSQIDSTAYTDSLFTNVNSQLVLNSTVSEEEIYTQKLIKSAAILEFYSQHGYETGTLKYDSKFISVSDDIQLTNISVNLGNGYQKLYNPGDYITYSITGDYQVGRAAIEYSLNNESFYDTLHFFVSTETYKYQDLSKSTERWDTGDQNFPTSGEPDFKYRIKYGCGNGRKIRRPVIIAPPYRPNLQPVSFNTYYDQFDFKSLISSMSDMGYDVIFVKETPGNRGINHAGGILAEFIKLINVQKLENYPDEFWENTVIGFSAGGQHWRYALKKLEKEHMDTGTPHHHTRLYIPFDSPQWGVNIPMFTQAVYSNLRHTNLAALMAYNSLQDEASKGMCYQHILGSNASTNNHVTQLYPAPTSERVSLMNEFSNSFNHQFTPINDLRRTFPTFTRNVAVSVGNNDADYTSEYGLDPDMLLFKQEFVTLYAFGGIASRKRYIYASEYSGNPTVFKRKDLTMVAFLIPVLIQRDYRTNNAYEWDMAQGGYKDEFYDGYALNLPFNINTGFIPLGAIGILKGSVSLTALGPLFGTKYYNSHINFLPTVSALGINPTIWQNNNLYYNVKDEGLMYNQFDIQNNPASDLYGYPNLGHPVNHFSITPFEAVYCDPQTYQHIKMGESVLDDGLDGAYLVHTRNFILDELEADVVYFQNQTIGKNHVQWDPNYTYKAWYKAYRDIVIGHAVTPKTDLGDYTIEQTGDITMYACHEINIKPGFSSENGSTFHAYIHCDGCSRPRVNKSASENETGNENPQESINLAVKDGTIETELLVYPNPSHETIAIVFPEATGNYVISNLEGRIFMRDKVGSDSKTLYISLPKGIYVLKWTSGASVQTKKIMIL